MGNTGTVVERRTGERRQGTAYRARQKTLRKILDAALGEFGEKGFGESSIVGITRRAKVALGTFYTYFDSKEAVFAALVGDMSGRVRDHVAPALEGPRATGSTANGGRSRPTLASSRVTRKSIGSSTRPNSSTRRDSGRITKPPRRASPRGSRAAAERGEIGDGDALAIEVRAWAIMGMNVFLGLRFGVWGDEDPAAVASEVNRMLRRGLEP